MVSQAWVNKMFLQSSPDSFLSKTAKKRLQVLHGFMSESDLFDLMDLTKMVALWEDNKRTSTEDHLERAIVYTTTHRVKKMMVLYETRRKAFVAALIAQRPLAKVVWV